MTLDIIHYHSAAEARPLGLVFETLTLMAHTFSRASAQERENRRALIPVYRRTLSY